MARRIGCVVLLLVLAAAGFLLGSCGTIRAGYMVRDALRPASELAPKVTESDLRVMCDGAPVRVRVYRPREETGPLPGVVLVHGAVTAGARDSRLIALARAMAIRGGTVATPDLDSLRAFRLDPADVRRVAATGALLARRGDLVADGKVAFVGISVGGSYGLLAALDPALEGRVSTVLTFGAYADLDVLLRRWMTDPTPDAPELLDPQTYGRRLVLRGNLDVLVPAEDREGVRGVLDRLLDGRSGDPIPENLTPAGVRVVEVGISEGPVDPAIVASLLDPLEASVSALSPLRQAAAPPVPVYLLHGRQDPVVPVADLATLAEHLREHGSRVATHDTDLFVHVGETGGGSPSLFRAWPLLSFLADAMSDAGF